MKPAVTAGAIAVAEAARKVGGGRELARRVRVSEAAIRAYAAGTRRPSRDVAARLAELGFVPLDAWTTPAPPPARGSSSSKAPSEPTEAGLLEQLFQAISAEIAEDYGSLEHVATETLERLALGLGVTELADAVAWCICLRRVREGVLRWLASLEPSAPAARSTRLAPKSRGARRRPAPHPGAAPGTTAPLAREGTEGPS